MLATSSFSEDGFCDEVPSVASGVGAEAWPCVGTSADSAVANGTKDSDFFIIAAPPRLLYALLAQVGGIRLVMS